MFGLLKSRNRNGTPSDIAEEQKRFRLNYCGTCKTIAKEYGQKERLFLNFDVVFLSELLDSIVDEATSFEYIKPAACFSLPQTTDQIPYFLKYTAAVNILLAYYKIQDNIIDSQTRLNFWKLLKYAENASFRKANQFLLEAGLSIQLIENHIYKQFRIEGSKKVFQDFQDTIFYYSQYTSKITGEIFKGGVIHLKDENLENNLRLIGEKFGTIVYLVDAWKDKEEDKKKGQFNCLLLEDAMPFDFKVQTILKYIYSELDQLKVLIQALPISADEKLKFINRVSINVDAVFNQKVTKCCSNHKRRLSLKERYKLAHQSAIRIVRNNDKKISNSLLKAGLALIMFCFFMTLPSFAQANVQHASCCDCRECCGPWCCPCSGAEGSNEMCDRAGHCYDKHSDDDRGENCFTMVCIGLACSYCCCNSQTDEEPTVIVITKTIVKPLIPKRDGCCDD